MRADLSFAIALLAAGGLCTAAGAGEAPRVARSAPADGATNVATNVGKLVVVFDRNMKMNSYSLAEAPAGLFPPMVKEDEPFEDPVTFVLTLKPLAPNTTYAVQLNTARKKGFKSAENETPLPVTVLTFTTGAAGGAEDEHVRVHVEPVAPRPLPPALAAAGLRAGTRFQVTRILGMKMTMSVPGMNEVSMKQLSTLEFSERVDKVVAGKIAEATRDVTKFSLEGTNPQTGQPQKMDLLQKPQAFRVVFSGAEQGVYEAESRQPVRMDELRQPLSRPLAEELFPPGALREGQEWSYEGADLTERLKGVNAQGGKLEMRVERFGREEGLACAYVAGKLRTRFMQNNVPFDFDGDVHVVQATALGIPLMTKLEGTLSGQTTMPGQNLQTVTVRGDVSSVQGCKPLPDDGRAPADVPVPPEKRLLLPPDGGRPGGQVNPLKPKMPTVAFQKTAEPREGAFTFLMPRGWTVEGGVFRVNPLEAHGAGNSLGAKCDLAVKREAAGSVTLRFLPGWAYADGPKVLPLFRYGSNYNGMLVRAMPGIEGFLTELFKTLHPQARDMKVVQKEARPDVVKAYEQGFAASNQAFARVGMAPMTFQSGALVFEYTEGGTRFKEALFGVLLDMRAAVGIWSNDRTLLMRAPLAEADAWKPVLETILYSLEINPQWWAGEQKGVDERSKIVMNTQRDIARMDREIADNRRRTMDRINTDHYLVLTDQNDYVNPHTGAVERDTNAWNHRWVSPSGEVVYTDSSNYNPNEDVNVARHDYQLSAPRR